MKKLCLLLVGAAALTLTGTLTNGASAADMAPVYKAPAAEVIPPLSGYTGLYLGGTWTNETFESSSGSAFVFGGEGRVNYWLSSTMSLQWDVEAEGTTNIKFGSSGDDGRIHGVVGAHLAWRYPTYALGVFGAITAASNLDYDGTMNHGIIGLEGQHYLGMLTLYGQVGWAGRLSGSRDFEPDHLWFIRGVGRYFFTPNDKIQVELGYAEGPAFNCSGSCTHHITNWGVLYEHKFGGPFSIYIEYAGFEERVLHRATEHMFMVGLKTYFYQPTLFANDRTGATFDMPKFVRALPWSWIVTQKPQP